MFYTGPFYVTAEHDIFGEALSDSDEDETNNNLLALDEDNSRLSCEDTSRLSDSGPLQVMGLTKKLLVEKKRIRKYEFFFSSDSVVTRLCLKMFQAS